MTAQPVDAVWVWHFGTAAQKATYGRLGNGYTKDYLQLSGDCEVHMVSHFPPAYNEATADTRFNLTYKWPKGQAAGFFKPSADRHHLSWGTVDGAPAPWKLTVNPVEEGPGTIPGDPTGSTSDEANEHLQTLEDKNLSAYLVAIKLRAEPDVLHIRAYIMNPPTDLAFASTEILPEAVRALTTKVGASRACASLLFNDEGAELTPDVAAVLEKFEDNPNLLFVGPPGTGKTVLLERLTKYIENPGKAVLFDPDMNHDAWSQQQNVALPGKTRTVVLHPSYSYDNLVLGLMPVPADNGVAVEASTGPLVNLAHYASEGTNRALLVLDEFNRGNAAAVLGDVLALLDKDKRGNTFVDLSYSDLKVSVPEEFAAHGHTTVSPRFTLPPNLWIAAAMNSSDRSVAPLDAALRRRFSIIEMPPDYESLSAHLKADPTADLGLPLEEWTVGAVGHLAVQLLRTLNDRIDAVLGQDFRLGQSNFWHVTGPTTEAMLQSLAAAWDRRVTQTLRLSLQDNDDLLSAILVAGSADQAPTNPRNRAAWWKAPHPSLGSHGNARLHFSELGELNGADIHSELLRLSNN
ncbi:5-methylcytosine-specific restriction protein B [Arthrobacter sp. CAN_A2]|uniref:McrB family protein n=1 Tax=Arthrobacter sp. CAN_A2 TaxID=2787718 RepID=UPI0018EF7BDB